MKRISIFSLTLAIVALAGCDQEVPELRPVSGEPGTANFSKFVSIGNSLTAGFQAGALFNEGQANSFPSIMAKQFELVSDNDPFDQPDINSVNGYNSTFSNPQAGVLRGRLILFDPDGTGPRTPTPAPAGTPGIPAPYNTADIPTGYTGDKTQLNNFGVPGILLAQADLAATGGPMAGNPAYNGLYARFATNPGTSTILNDALATDPTFFTFWLGNNDVLGYATTGGSGAVALTPVETFTALYTAAIDKLLAESADIKGVIATIPDVTSIPFFRTVVYNPVPLDQSTATALNQGFAGYNAVLDGIKANAQLMAAFQLTAQGLDARKISFAAGTNNAAVIIDEDLVDLGGAFDAVLQAGQMTQQQRDALVPYEQVRQTTSADLITLSAGSVLGTVVNANPQLINGLTVPLGDQYVLIPSEITAVRERTNAFNTVIRNQVTENSTRLALADINAEFTKIVTRETTSVDGISVNATFAPPFGLFSEDGVHPNNRGSAFIARVFIQAINDAFGSTVPLPNISMYKSTTVPVTP